MRFFHEHPTLKSQRKVLGAVNAFSKGEELLKGESDFGEEAAASRGQ